MKTKSFLYIINSVFAALLILTSISYITANNNLQTADNNSDTIHSLKDATDNKSIYKSPGGNYYEVTMEHSWDSGSEIALRGVSLDCSNDNFSGHDRKKAKTSIAEIGTDNYNSINELINTLQSDNEMINHNPPISHKESSNRVFEEKRNAKILNTFIYAIKREPDNDFHIIIGNVPDNHVYLNIENSGLPGGRSKSYRKLKAVRKKFEDKFGELCSTAYLKFNPPVPVLIEGSLFYDIDHRPGAVGPAGLKPATSWEIHPVTDVVFGD